LRDRRTSTVGAVTRSDGTPRMVVTGFMTWTYCNSFSVCQSRACLGMGERSLYSTSFVAPPTTVLGSTTYGFPD
jgi:hypothetical protein